MAHHSQTITRAKTSRTARPASTPHDGGQEHIELHRSSCQNAASGLRLDAGGATTLVLLAREGPCLLGTLPVLVPLPFPLPGKATTVDVRLAGSPSRVLQLAGRFADAAVVADLQLSRLPSGAQLVLGH